MPNLITHMIFADDVLKDISNDKYKNDILNNIEEYHIGCNGPDFLFFYGAELSFKRKQTKLNKIGSYLHKNDINKLYEIMIDTYLKTNDKKDAMASYIIGHYLHLVMDSIMHPFVVYNTGFGKPYNIFHHHRFESNMDAINLLEFKGETIKTFKTYEICKRSLNSNEVISKLYTRVIRECCDYQVSNEAIVASLKDWEKAQHYLYDPRGIKTKFLKVYEYLVNIPYLVSGNIVPAKIDNTYDIMNLSRREWLHPVSGEKSNDSFRDLYEKALKEAQIGLNYLFEALDDKGSDMFLNFIDNKTYSNGIKGNQERHYQDDIYER